GSDAGVYRPMSEQLAALGIPVYEGYAPAHLDWGPDQVVVGNVHSKDHVEVLAAQVRGIPLTSFPAILGELFLAGRHSIVVAGTHGKTTTTSLIAHILFEARRHPSFFVGGVPIGFGHGPEFVVEGDEYDTAFFDKGSKFLHYHAKTAILTSVELDHVDIFSSMEEVKNAFRKLVALLPDDGLLIVCADQPEAVAVAQGARGKVETYAVVDDAEAAPGGATWWASGIEYLKSGRVAFDVYRNGDPVRRFAA